MNKLEIKAAKTDIRMAAEGHVAIIIALGVTIAGMIAVLVYLGLLGR
jgi:hypothetical protein